MQGLFITFEGIEGCGKTTQAKLLYEHLLKEGRTVLLTEEPGGTEIGLKIRSLLLDRTHEDIHPLTELFLYNASRVQHVMEKIRPLLKKGYTVICDRFMDSTFAYQGYGRGINMEIIKSLDQISRQGLKPDITFLLDIEPEVGLKRHASRELDRLEKESIEFHKAVRKGYLDIARSEPDRITVIPAERSIDEIHEMILEKIRAFMNNRR
ncbi:MAG: dTMP kinase [Thermodesulfovibrionales bacterium]|nr:dTMP kinase [Thermodesulfovibrionales bacterium]